MPLGVIKNYLAPLRQLADDAIAPILIIVGSVRNDPIAVDLRH